MPDVKDLHEYAISIARRGNRETMAATIEKELLHYEILDALDRSGLLETLVFQGGTSLRLCYGAERYSEDLDFSGGRDFDADRFVSLKECIEQAVSSRYHVETQVRTPKRTSGLVSAWTVIVDTTPKRSDIARQRIKIEIASIDAHDPVYRPLTINYEDLPDSYAEVFVPVESREEILADKVEAFVCSDHMRFRDLWDMAWLSRQPGLDLGKTAVLRRLKEHDYGEEAKYPERYPLVGAKLDEAFNSDHFSAEMRRFLPSDRIQRTVAREVWLKATQQQLSELFRQYSPE